MRNYLLKRVQTMTISKVPWRKPPKPKQFAVANGRTEQSREGRDRHCFQFQYTPLPGRQTVPICLSKSMMVAVPTHARAVIKADTQFQQKEDAARKGCILIKPLFTFISDSLLSTFVPPLLFARETGMSNCQTPLSDQGSILPFLPQQRTGIR